MGWCRVNYIGLIGVVGVGFCFYQSGMMVLRQYKVFSVDSCFINKQMEITNERI
jgi:hypothetical protein